MCMESMHVDWKVSHFKWTPTNVSLVVIVAASWLKSAAEKSYVRVWHIAQSCLYITFKMHALKMVLLGLFLG